MGLQFSDRLHSPGHRSRMLSLRDLTPPGTQGYQTAALPHARVTVSVAALLVIQHPEFQELRVKYAHRVAQAALQQAMRLLLRLDAAAPFCVPPGDLDSAGTCALTSLGNL